jgi:hypothetical protein
MSRRRPPPIEEDDDDGTDVGIEPAAPVPATATKVVNPLLRVLLRLPLLHRLVSGSLMLITVTGRRTGDTYTFPVGYERRGDAVYVTSHGTNWWKNLRDGGQEVTLHLRGERLTGHAVVHEDPPTVADYVHGYLSRHGIKRHARRVGLNFRRDDLPDARTLAFAVDHVVLVEVDLDPDPDGGGDDGSGGT